jgi:hypothetical protein
LTVAKETKLQADDIDPFDTAAQEDSWDASAEGWERVGDADGDEIDWSETPRFEGIYLGSGIKKNKQGEEFDIYRFTDRSGTARFSWGAYQLDEAFENVPLNSQARITWKGIRDLGEGKGGRTLNQFEVLIKRP